MVSSPDRRCAAPFANDFCGTDRSAARKKKCKYRLNLRFTVILDRVGLPYVFLMATRDIQAGETGLTDYGDRYWQNWQINMTALRRAGAMGGTPPFQKPLVVLGYAWNTDSIPIESGADGTNRGEDIEGSGAGEEEGENQLKADIHVGADSCVVIKHGLCGEEREYEERYFEDWDCGDEMPGLEGDDGTKLPKPGGPKTFDTQQQCEAKCVVCGDLLNELTLLEREIHTNRCLDGKGNSSDQDLLPALLTKRKRSKKRPKPENLRDSGSQWDCPVCNSGATYGESPEEHLNRCLDTEPLEPSSRDVTETQRNWLCPICEDFTDKAATMPKTPSIDGGNVSRNMSVQARRLAHIKKCGRALGVGPKALREHMGLPALTLDEGDGSANEEQERGVFNALGDPPGSPLRKEARVDDGQRCDRESKSDEFCGGDESEPSVETLCRGNETESPNNEADGSEDEEPECALPSAFSQMMKSARNGGKTLPSGPAAWFPVAKSFHSNQDDGGGGGGSGGGKGGARGGKGDKGGKWSGGRGNVFRHRGGARSVADVPSYKIVPLIAQPAVVVDGFTYASKELSDVYVLTHFHADHYQCLTGKTWAPLGAAGCVVYCSEVTAKLAVAKLGVDPKHLRPLPVTPFVAVGSGASSAPGTPSFSRQSGVVLGGHVWTRLRDGAGRGLALDVALFDANHCPGAAMW
jgi:hypothetical protein